jgi:DNA polymerase III epsilon subunit-like protein
MKIIIFDTETTGFPNKGPLSGQPYVVQFASITLAYDSDKNTFTEIDRKNLFIKPDIPIPKEVSKIHGIYDKDVEDKPKIQEQIDIILEVFQNADIAIAHNLDFDKKMIEIQLLRTGKPKNFLPEQVFDSMHVATNLCKIPNARGGYKYPKLEELYKFLFKKSFPCAHNAIYDVEATVHVVGKLIEKKVIVPQKSEYETLF